MPLGRARDAWVRGALRGGRLIQCFSYLSLRAGAQKPYNSPE